MKTSIKRDFDRAECLTALNDFFRHVNEGYEGAEETQKVGAFSMWRETSPST